MNPTDSGVDQEKPPDKSRNFPDKPGESAAYDSAVDEFFARLNRDMRHPKPGTESITAALQAVQRLALETDSEEAVNAAAEGTAEHACRVCGKRNPPGNRFCALCGVPLQESPPQQQAVPAGEPKASSGAAGSGQHHYHHHYHHHYFSGAEALSPAGASAAGPAGRDAARVRAPLTGPALSRAEAAARNLSQDWALACNTRQLDDLVALYATDAMVLRPNLPAVRGTAAIREFFFAALDSGLGEVELEPVRLELFGDIAYEAGRCKMLVPVAVGKRREERGKYLIIFNRQAAGDWKILADCWSSDLSLGIGAESGASKPTVQPPINPLARLPRKNG